MMNRSSECRIPPLQSGGILLSYRCNSACRHCLYQCSPRQPDEWLDPDTAGRIFEALAREPELTGIHLAGGEPTLRLDRLVDILRLAVRRGIPIDYVETNGSTCRDAAAAESIMRQLYEAGLRGILISASMFHNEFIPMEATRNAVRAAEAVFGAHRVYVYVASVYAQLQAMGDGTRPLSEYMRRMGWGDDYSRLPAHYPVIPGGRAATALRRCFTPQPASSFRSLNCRADLRSTRHFHIDPHGYLFTGLCPGVVSATAEDFHPVITPATHPVFAMLSEGGPCRLMDEAGAGIGFQPRLEGYVSKCDLCLQLRTALARAGRFPEELKPVAFYGESPIDAREDTDPG